MPILSLIVTAAVAACAPAVGASPSADATSPLASGAASASTGVALPFPAEPGEELVIGRHAISPPFDIPFTFDIGEPGWESLHLIGEFTDIAQWDGPGRSGAPPRSIAFGHPVTVGTDRTPAAGVTPAAAAAHLAGQGNMTVSEVAPFSLDERDGVVVDIHAPESNTILFGGPRGSLGIGPDRDVRVAIVQLESDLLFVVASAEPTELDALWRQAGSILASIDLPAR